MLRKKERRAAEKARRDRMASTGSEGSIGGNVESASSGPVRKKSSPAAVGGGEGGPVSSGAEDKKKRKLDK